MPVRATGTSSNTAGIARGAGTSALEVEGADTFRSRLAMPMGAVIQLT